VEGAGKKVGGGSPFSGIPRLARGGITDGLSFAGEEGPEAVIPLGRTLRARMDRARVMQESGLTVGGATTINVHVASDDPEAVVQRIRSAFGSQRVRMGGAL